MPSVGVAMERSLQEGRFREGAVNLLVASLRPVLGKRSTILNSVNDVKTSFSSWDNCMLATYCKWPVIALIIVGGLIVLSVIWCIARCACCAKSCCCECFYCLKCCGNCCGCCDTPKGTPSKHLDDPYMPPPGQGYRANAPMTTGVAEGWKPGAAPTAHEPPQYAEFDVSKKGTVSDDALPAMPSWNDTPNTKVAIDDPVELAQLPKAETGTTSAVALAGRSQSVPLVAGARSGAGSVSPASPSFGGDPYGPQDPHAASGPYLADPYGNNGTTQGYGYSNNGSYGQQSAASLDQDPGYGAAAGMDMAAGGRRTHGNARGGGGYGPGSRQASRDNYGGYGAGDQGYGAAQSYGAGRRSPPRGPPNNTMDGGAPYGYNSSPRRSPAPPQDDYDYGGHENEGPFGPPQRQYSSESTRPLAASRPPPQRQYSSHSAAPSSPIQNNSGFDFNSGYTRPQEQGYDDGFRRRPSGPTSRQETTGSSGGYPGYKPYNPSSGGSGNHPGQQAWSGV